ncbi:MAG: 2-octaprenyl-6-methoxyphenyl hydroxylase [gamma proteobacterium symbiont of Bathyaustriella thionipta]|nr:2-octaprenyl-6-methoxyphenyl hydroxylase [gamma proteobacterium symbiont of Bathyaustriella thionipta]MCU7948464.1 2-octaprenyl-6-methoxyphenyl hydroxylase [gamma proteobacterium symbiont of Bathyaustriella thionipta]MCU7952460.1 2-octaprenyl-6-methoxyphenyl hydroxylase [gamma proteobacterium symbiont of Bathyaustriella thionipta]MCU7955386.1 2-octaprenyl-6-methoxyphenyl hydroxylase [gamma proteobacterium symbiont of Bathyaustriella thionipta]MCU7966214.1 2-octaprenyl-6-methoxyphenyl hydroxy
MTQQSNPHFDIIIVGGGMAGATMALALAPLKLSLAVIEAHPYQDEKTQPSFDDRCLALAWSSRQIYHAMGIWDKLAQCDGDGFAAIKHIHISDRGHLGITRLDHQKEGVPALGYVVESRVVGEVLLHEMQNTDNISIFSPATVQQVETSTEQVKVSIQFEQKTQSMTAGLMIVADGVNSRTRASLGIQINQQSYAQTAIIANIETEMPHQNVAYERFTDSGPLAVLPLTRNRCSLVWTARDDQVADIMAMNDAEFLSALQQRFGYRLGQIIRTGRRAAYPLVLMTINNDTLAHQNRIALIGNAAHGVHPVAGQGFNLGLRDISALAELIAAEMQHTKQGDPGNKDLLTAYWQWRQADIRQVTNITNSLIKLFSNQSTPLAVLRNSGLLMADIMSPLKHAIAHEAMGSGKLQGKLSKMAVGRSLY